MAAQDQDVDLAAVLDAAPFPLLVLTPDLVVVAANRARLEQTSTTLEQNLGRPLFDLFPANPREPEANGVERLRASLERVLATGEPDTMAVTRYDIRGPDGSFVERHWAPRNVPVLDDDGHVVLVLHCAEDVTAYVHAQRAAREERERDVEQRARSVRIEADLLARTRELEELTETLRRTSQLERESARRLAGLAATISALAGAQTFDDVLSALGRVAGPAAGASGVVVGVRRGELVDVVRVDGAGPHGLPGVDALPLAASVPLADACRGERVLVSAGARGGLLGTSTTALAREDTVGLAWAVLPLRSGRRVVGALALGWPEVPTDLTLVEAIAAQCGTALERVQRLTEERERAAATRNLAETLQRSLLTDPPQPDHLQIAVRYRPAAREAQVGGDWYDAFVSADGATTLAVGDVTGHDRVAAAVMGQLRNLLRGVAHAVDAPPARVLTRLDQAMRDLAVGALATVVLARVEQEPDEAGTGLRILRWSSAGHPPPLLLEPDRTPVLLERRPDLLLGVDPRTDRGDHAVTLEPGATVLLYTDGLVERRGEPLATGLARLAAVAADAAELPLEELCEVLLARLAPDPDDDVALVALRAHPEDRPRPDGRPVGGAVPRIPPRRRLRDLPAGDAVGWTRVVATDLPDDSSAPRLARVLLAEALAREPAAGDGQIARLLVSELATNAVRHGRGSVRMRVLTRPDRLRGEVHDGGAGMPAVHRPGPEAEGGRGMWLVEDLSTDWGVIEHRGEGKDVWFEMAAGRGPGRDRPTSGGAGR